MDRLSATIFATLGCPAELVLGVGGSSAHVATSTVTQESLRAAVKSWRTLLARRAEIMYWRIHGDDTIKYLADMADDLGIKLTPIGARMTMMDLTVKFTFRDKKLDVPTAMMLCQSGYITRREFITVLMDTFGLSESAFVQEQPISDQKISDQKISDQQIPDQKGGGGIFPRTQQGIRAPKMPTQSTSFGDMGIGDSSGTGFSDGVRKPSSLSRTTNLSMDS